MCLLYYYNLPFIFEYGVTLKIGIMVITTFIIGILIIMLVTPWVSIIITNILIAIGIMVILNVTNGTLVL